MELFTLPFEKVLIWPFYDFISFEPPCRHPKQVRVTHAPC